MRNGTCRSCNAPMLWALTNTGKRNPLDAFPHEDGNVVVIATGSERGELELCVVLREDALERARLLGVPLYRSHFATCPHRDEHRGGGKGKQAPLHNAPASAPVDPAT